MFVCCLFVVCLFFFFGWLNRIRLRVMELCARKSLFHVLNKEGRSVVWGAALRCAA